MSKTATRCCSCGDEIAVGSDFWHGANEDERACSMLCRYRSLCVAAGGWSMTRRRSPFGKMRVEAAKEALLYDPEIFDQEGLLDVTIHSTSFGSRTAAMIPIEVANESIRLEIVMGDYADEEIELRWDEIVDMVLRDA